MAQPPPKTQGPINAVPCPYCGKHNNFLELDRQTVLDTGNQVWCDHCGYSMEVTNIVTVKFVAVRQDPTRAPRQIGSGRPAAQATTISHAQLKRLTR